MLPRIRVPDARINEERSAFVRGTRERFLRVVVDDTSLSNDEACRLLFGFGYHPHIQLVRQGPWDGPRMEILPKDDSDDVARVIVSDQVGKEMMLGVWPVSQWERFAAQDAALTNEREAEILRQYMLAAAAREFRADALVTGSAHLISSRDKPILRDTNPVTKEEALALVGLYLRSRQDFTIWKDRAASLSLNAGMFYWILARELLNSSWRWHSACAASGRATGDDIISHLGGSAILRFDQALRARDRLHIQLKLPQNNDTADEALFYLDSHLLFLSGAFDAAARVAHITYGVAGDRRYASWRRDGWRADLARVAPHLAQLMDPANSARDTLELVALLRNSIHGEALRSIAYQRGGHELENLLLIPGMQVSEILAAVGRGGGNARWGVRQTSPDNWVFEIDVFIEALLVQAMAALNDLMDATQVERLPGVDAGALPSGPLVDDQTWSQETRTSVRLLAGFP